jgi:hypothetical protein
LWFLLFGFLWIGEIAIDVQNRHGPVERMGLPGNQAAHAKDGEISITGICCLTIDKNKELR